MEVFLRVCRYASDFLPNIREFFSLGLLRNGKIKGNRAWAPCYVCGSTMVYFSAVCSHSGLALCKMRFATRLHSLVKTHKSFEIFQMKSAGYSNDKIHGGRCIWLHDNLCPSTPVSEH